ncbi:MAG: hypothetical protein LC114_26765 [Bryobacterales bacterium]|nr:hypothetical protein [Bryobacterales bacterium]
MSAAILLVGCAAVNDSSCAQVPTMAAGENEPTFAERYSVNIVLPVAEEEFLAVVRSLGLKYSTMGPNGEFPLTLPVHCPSMDMSAVDHGYRISGGEDPKTGRAEAYIALADKAKQIIYVENRFQYPAVVR